MKRAGLLEQMETAATASAMSPDLAKPARALIETEATAAPVVRSVVLRRTMSIASCIPIIGWGQPGLETVDRTAYNQACCFLAATPRQAVNRADLVPEYRNGGRECDRWPRPTAILTMGAPDGPHLRQVASRETHCFMKRPVARRC